MRAAALTAVALLLGCEAAPESPREAPPLEPAGAAARPDACADLAARPDPESAAVALRVCEDLPLSAARGRAALLAVRSPADAARLVPRLAAHPDLQGLARLAAFAPPGARVTDLTPAAQVVATPVDDRVLAEVALAHRRMWEPGIEDAARTRAAAFLHRVYLQALEQLGLEAPLPPFARLLAGRALHHGRVFCTRYWQRRVAGLERSFGEAEVALYEVLRQLEASPHSGDGATLILERTRARRYILRSGPTARIEKRRGADAGPVELLPLANDLARLVDHGLVDTAFERGLAAASTASGPGLAPMEALLRETLSARDLTEHVALLERRLASARARTPAPPEQGPGSLDHPVDPSWPTDAEVAASLEGLLANTELPAQQLAVRLEVELLGRPEATLALLSRSAEPDASEALAAQRPTLRALANAQLDRGMARLHARSADEPLDGEAAIRRSFATAAAGQD